MKDEYEGMFEVLDSFAIRKRNQFYLIGNLTKGKIKENWFLNIPFNDSLAMTLRINSIENVEMASDGKEYFLIIVDTDESGIDLFLTLKINLEYLPITIKGVD